MQRVVRDGFIANDGTKEELDAIIYATGFDTSWVPRFPIKAHGKNLQDVWAQEGPLSYLAVAVPEVPNLFSFAGPVSLYSIPLLARCATNSPQQYGPLAVGSLLPIIEHLTNYICKVITKMQVENIESLQPKLEPALAFREHHNLYVRRMAWAGPCSSWFKKGDPNGSLTMYPGSRVHFFELLKEPRYEDYM
jgi:hypothetical protein